MKLLVTYSSRTGNTKKVAEAIISIMPAGTEIYPVEEAPPPQGYDFIAFGFWVNRETADQTAQAYVRKINSRKVALFATLGAEPNSVHARKSMDNVISMLAPGNELVGEFICQGKIDPKITEALAKLPPGHPHALTPERKARHDRAASHPDEQDLQNARTVYGGILRRLGI